VSSEGRVLVVEPDDAQRRAAAAWLREAFGEVQEEADSASAVKRLRDPDARPFDVVVTELRLPGADGVEVLRAARERDPACAVLLVSADPSVEAVVRAMRHGALDFLVKPISPEALELRVADALEHARKTRARALPSDPPTGTSAAGGGGGGVAPSLVGGSASLAAAVELATRVAPTRSTVLLTGETGTGKELFAELIHARSTRARGPFVQVNCAALPETLLESELFGHERGAFTGADRTRIGRFEQANGGTLFLDEIGDMSTATQAKLLRALQDQEFHRLGGTHALRTDARIVAATNRDLEAAIRAGRFREDLYFRLDVIGIRLPPLRERPGDVEALARHFLGELARTLGRPLEGFDDATLAALRVHPWPGNVRELRNVVERAALMADGPRIARVELGPAGRGGRGAAELALEGLTLGEAERLLVVSALRRAGFVQKRAAKLLGVSRRKLNYIVARLGVTHPSWRRHRGAPPAAGCAAEGARPGPADS
jgi:two-component system response regulator HydG